MLKPERDPGSVPRCGIGGHTSGPGPEALGRKESCRAPISERPRPGTPPPSSSTIKLGEGVAIASPSNRDQFSPQDQRSVCSGSSGHRSSGASGTPNRDAGTHGGGAGPVRRPQTEVRRSPPVAGRRGREGTPRTRPYGRPSSPRRPEARHGPGRKDGVHPAIVRETSSPCPGP
jgi:hypothetical protein